MSEDGPTVKFGDLDLTNSFVFTMSRPEAIMYGHVKPTVEEVEEYNADSRARWERSVADWAAMDAAAAGLTAVDDPLARRLLDLHSCAADAAVCVECSFDGGDDPWDEQWPCATVRVVADQFGVTLPDGYLGSRPGDSPHEMPPDGYRPFSVPIPRWHDFATEK